MKVEYRKFVANDRLFLVADATVEQQQRATTLVSTSGSEAQLQVMKVYLGTHRIPADSLVLIRQGRLQDKVRIGDVETCSIVLADVEAFLPLSSDNKDKYGGPLLST